MTPEEFCKKWCYNGHDASICQKLKDLKELIASEVGKALDDFVRSFNENS